MGDAGPEITNGLGAFLYALRSKPGFGRSAVSRLLHDLDRPHVATKPLWTVYDSLV